MDWFQRLIRLQETSSTPLAHSKYQSRSLWNLTQDKKNDLSLENIQECTCHFPCSVILSGCVEPEIRDWTNQDLQAMFTFSSHFGRKGFWMCQAWEIILSQESILVYYYYHWSIPVLLYIIKFKLVVWT